MCGVTGYPLPAKLEGRGYPVRAYKSLDGHEIACRGYPLKVYFAGRGYPRVPFRGLFYRQRVPCFSGWSRYSKARRVRLNEKYYAKEPGARPQVNNKPAEADPRFPGKLRKALRDAERRLAFTTRASIYYHGQEYPLGSVMTTMLSDDHYQNHSSLPGPTITTRSAKSPVQTRSLT
ncbi:hypothetical protein BDZ85DRAFT_251151 [Elsinoe ampelina]|uniref:Uncharacterized protein n=1 Tax=Elsinoe ampelina TaxID=302913 RepID=A0A6A6G6T3_9PEZI|nr:hypothetical protein BDZ85DRAFT_251151 [Elsinoe ampelina]